MDGEVGGRAEEDAADWIMGYQKRTANPKPIMGLIGSIHAPPGRIMGHAGAWAEPGECSSAGKIRALERAGAVTVDHPERFGTEMKRLLEFSGNKKTVAGPGAIQRRGPYSSSTIETGTRSTQVHYSK